MKKAVEVLGIAFVVVMMGLIIVSIIVAFAREKEIHGTELEKPSHRTAE